MCVGNLSFHSTQACVLPLIPVSPHAIEELHKGKGKVHQQEQEEIARTGI